MGLPYTFTPTKQTCVDGCVATKIGVMDIRSYLEINDPLERLAQTSEALRLRNDEIRQIGKIRAAAVIEAYEARIHPKQIAQAGGFNISRFRQILKEANYTPKFDWRPNSKATQFKKLTPEATYQD